MTAAFTAAMTLLLVGIGLPVYWSMSGALLDELDSGLRFRAAAIASPSPHALVETPNPLLEERAEAFDQLLAGDGRIMRSSAGLPPGPLLSLRELAAVHAPTFFVRHVAGVQDAARLLAVPIKDGKASEVLIVGATMADRADELASLVLVFAVGGPVAVLLASLTGWWVAGLGFRPVERMRRQAAAITASGLDHRLDLPVAEDEVRRLGATLNQMLDRLEAAAQHDRRFLERASHELRTPLTALKAELDVAASGPGDVATLSAAIASATEETNRVIRLANDLLALARTHSGRMPISRATHSVRWLLECASAASRARAEAHQITLDVDAPGISAFLDAMRVRQVLDNLIDNALRHTPPGGTITLAARASQSSIDITVRDTGSGFAAPDQLQRRLRRDGDILSGHGLGLRIADSVAASHGGRLLLANREPHGAEVTVEIASAAVQSADGEEVASIIQDLAR
ncbi:MAG: HAMP domain-containing protein [Streptosporangiaceae bacterium]|nr:HAMP domain-containing protein [Streptosporangiaceae bacterium]MBV9853055.1 HAMP domain-containing protein [Streptosporangiaceae bacterium]